MKHTTTQNDSNLNHETILVNENPMKQTSKTKEKNTFTELKLDKATILADFRLANLSRFLSITGTPRSSDRQSQIRNIRRRKGDNPDCHGKAIS